MPSSSTSGPCASCCCRCHRASGDEGGNCVCRSPEGTEGRWCVPAASPDTDDPREGRVGLIGFEDDGIVALISCPPYKASQHRCVFSHAPPSPARGVCKLHLRIDYLITHKRPDLRVCHCSKSRRQSKTMRRRHDARADKDGSCRVGSLRRLLQRPLLPMGWDRLVMSLYFLLTSHIRRSHLHVPLWRIANQAHCIAYIFYATSYSMFRQTRTVLSA